MHTLSDSVVLHDIRNLTLVTNYQGTTNITCNGSAGFIFQNASEIKLVNLSFMHCGQKLWEPLQINGEITQATLAFGEVTNLQIESVSVSWSAGYGILG